jgi:hypothetical protein
VSFLLDVNVLVAWGWQDHVDHERTVHWIVTQKKSRGVDLVTSPIPEIGFVRVSVQRGLGRVTMSEAAAVLRSMLQSLGRRHRFLADDVSGTIWPEWCQRPGQTTNAHLARLAAENGLKLATLDAEIPKAFLLPLRQV